MNEETDIKSKLLEMGYIDKYIEECGEIIKDTIRCTIVALDLATVVGQSEQLCGIEKHNAYKKGLEFRICPDCNKVL